MEYKLIKTNNSYGLYEIWNTEDFGNHTKYIAGYSVRKLEYKKLRYGKNAWDFCTKEFALKELETK